MSWSVSELLKLFNEQECIMLFSNFKAYLLFKMEIWKIINFLEFWFWLHIALYNLHVCNLPVLSPFSMPLSRMYWIIFRYCNSSCFLGFTFSSLIGNVEDSRAELSKPSTANIFRRCDSYCQQMKGWKKIPNCRVIIYLLSLLTNCENHQVTFHSLENMLIKTGLSLRGGDRGFLWTWPPVAFKGN